MKEDFKSQIKEQEGTYSIFIIIEKHKEEIKHHEFKFSNQSLQLKSVARDHNRAKQEVEKLSSLNDTLNTKVDELKENKLSNEQEIQKLQQRCKDLEEKLKFDASAVSWQFYQIGSR